MTDLQLNRPLTNPNMFLEEAQVATPIANLSGRTTKDGLLAAAALTLVLLKTLRAAGSGVVPNG
jgi:hypothetical protein